MICLFFKVDITHIRKIRINQIERKADICHRAKPSTVTDCLKSVLLFRLSTAFTPTTFQRHRSFPYREVICSEAVIVVVLVAGKVVVLGIDAFHSHHTQQLLCTCCCCLLLLHSNRPAVTERHSHILLLHCCARPSRYFLISNAHMARCRDTVMFFYQLNGVDWFPSLLLSRFQ